MPKRQEIERFLLSLAPSWLADEDEKPGLQISTSDEEIKDVLIGLDPTEKLIQEAVRLKCQLIITHHPLLYKPLQRISDDNPLSRVIINLCRNSMNLLCLHSNWDYAEYGLNHYLAQILKLQNTRPLERKEEKVYKLVTFVPYGHEDAVREAICRAGAGWIGNYSYCTFQAAGTGTFYPLEGASPFLGEVGKLEKAEEYRLETIFKESQREAVLNALFGAHPYEEVAYDIYPLANEGVKHGLGRVGKLVKPLQWQDFLEYCRESLEISDLRWQSRGHDVVNVAVCGGKGTRLISAAKKAGADVFITGDIGHHDWILGEELGISLIDAGHGGLEKWFISQVAACLREKFTGLNIHEAPPECIWK